MELKIVFSTHLLLCTNDFKSASSTPNCPKSDYLAHIYTCTYMYMYMYTVIDRPRWFSGTALHGVQEIAGSIPSRDIPIVVKRWYNQLLSLRSALGGECLEI